MYRLFVSHPGENRRLALERPRYPEDVLQLFGDRRRIPVTDRRLLDRVHVEFQLAAEAQPIDQEIDSQLHAVEPSFSYHHEAHQDDEESASEGSTRTSGE